MSALLQTLTASELLNTGDIDTVDAGTVVGQQSSERATNHLGAVHNTDSVSEEAITVRQYRVVDVEVFEDLNDSERGAGEDALLSLGLGIKETNVLVHVENVTVAQTLYILIYVDNLLQVLVLAVVENGVVYDDAVDIGIGIGSEDSLLEIIAGNFTEGVAEATVQWIKRLR